MRTLIAAILLLASFGASYRSDNFIVTASTPELAKEIADAAEQSRVAMARLWLGQELPQWGQPCKVAANVAANLGAGGATSYVFDRGEVYGWNMNIQGSRERILDSVIPHELSHTILASYFRCPVPRWADEGAATTVECPSEIARHEEKLLQYLRTGRGIPFEVMFKLSEYPVDVMPLYSQGHSLCRWLIERRGHKEFVAFLADGMSDGDWQRAVKSAYGFDSLMDMQAAWNDWVIQGRPAIAQANYNGWGVCVGGQCTVGGGCSNGSCGQPRVIYSQPVRQQPPPTLRPSSAPELPVTSTTVIRNQTPTIDTNANCEKQAADIAALKTQISQYRECNCDGCCDKVKAELNARIETLAQSQVSINNTIQQLEQRQPETPNYDIIAAEVGKRLPPINMRVTPEGKYQPVKLGSYVTLPLDKK